MTRSILFFVLLLSPVGLPMWYGCSDSSSDPSASTDTGVFSDDSDQTTVSDGGMDSGTQPAPDAAEDSATPMDLPNADADPVTDRSALPYLPSGQHLSAIVGFELYSPITTERVDAIWRDALDAGMEVGRLQIDWADLETGPGQYNEAPLREGLARMKEDGLKPFVSIYAVDSEGLVIPADLFDENSPTQIVDGRSLDDPDILARYRAVLDWAVPLIVEEGGWVLSIANEPEGYMEDYLDESPAVIAFFADAVEHAHTLDAGLPITVTLTGSPILEKHPVHDDVMELLDVATYNYYPLAFNDIFALELRAPLEAYVSDDVDKLIAAAMGKQVLIQELGCPAGYADGGLVNSTPEDQALFFRLFLDKMVNTPELRAAFVFQIVDWSEELSALYSAPPGTEEALLPTYDSLREWLETVGLITYADGTARPALDIVLDGIGQVRR